MALTLSPSPWFTGFDDNGDIVPGGKLFTYAAGTSTKKNTYTDVDGQFANTNPIILDDAGRVPSGLFLLPSSYKYVLSPADDTDPPTNPIRTQDNIGAVPTTDIDNDVSGTAGEAMTASQAAYLSDGSGGLIAGRWYLTDADQTYSSTLPEVAFVVTTVAAAAVGTFRLSGRVTGLSTLTPGANYYIGSTPGGIVATAPSNTRFVGQADSISSLVVTPNPPLTTAIESVINTRVKTLCNGRLTLASGVPVTTTDVTSASTIYWTPYQGNEIGLYDASGWTVMSFTETLLALGTLVNAQAYDVFAYNNAGTLAIESAEWKNAVVTMTIAAPGAVTWTAHGMSTGNSVTFTTTGALPTGVSANTQYWITVVDVNTFRLSTTMANVAAGTFITTSGTQSGVHTAHQPQARQTELVLQDGVYVKTGATTRRYLGTFLATTTATTEDSLAKRCLWNYYNRVVRPMRVYEATASWAYVTATYRQARASVVNQLEFIRGLEEDDIEAQLYAFVADDTGGTSAWASIGLDSTATVSALSAGGMTGVPDAGSPHPITAMWRGFPGIGRRTLVWLERGNGSATTMTWYGANGFATAMQSGLNGWLRG